MTITVTRRTVSLTGRGARGVQGVVGPVGPAGTVNDFTGTLVGTTAANSHYVSLRFTGAPSNYNFAVTKFPAYSLAGDCYSYYQGINAHVSGGREDPTKPGMITFMEMPFRESGRPDAGEYHLAMNGLDSTHVRAWSAYMPIAGSVAGSFQYWRSDEYMWHNWQTNALLLSRSTAGVWKYEAGEVVHFRSDSSPVQYQVTAANILPLPYYDVNGRVQLGGLAEATYDLFAGRYLRLGTVGQAYPEFTIGGAATTEARIELRGGGTGAGTVGGSIHFFPSFPLDIRALNGLQISSGSGTPWAAFSAAGLSLVAGLAYQINGTQVVGTRKTGWAVDTGTAKRTANATYAPGATLTYGAAYVQAEHTATATRLALIEAALRDATQTIKALKDDLHATAGHGLIGT